MSAGSILIVDDDAEIRELIAMYVREHHFRAVEARDGEEALRQLQDQRPDLIVLDVNMPDMDGFAVCERMRRKSNAPILFLSSRWGGQDIVRALEAGGDDYIVKPFQPEVLLARIRANLRRTRMADSSEQIVFGDLVLNRSTFEASCRGVNIPFLAKEIKLLMYLAERPRHIFHIEQLYEEVWRLADGDARTVMVHISNIRQKLLAYAPDTVKIETVRGIGYRLIP